MGIQRLTREKHLNHLVRVVPLLSLAYGIQSYLMMKWSQGGPTGALVLLLGVCLAISVLGMAFYDQRHQVLFDEAGFRVRPVLGLRWRRFTREDVSQVEIEGGEDEFQNVTVHLKRGRSLVFRFVDNGHAFQHAMRPDQQERRAA
jgi:hypothetical protein